MSTLAGSAALEIEAPIESCWAVVEAVPTAPEWQGGLKRMVVIERDDQGRASICDVVNDAKLWTVTTRVKFDYQRPTRLSWTQVEPGDLEHMDGGWELEDLGGGRTRATYRLELDPGRLGLFARGPVQATIRARFVSGRPKELAARVASAA